jgi:hypothetical protein
VDPVTDELTTDSSGQVSFEVDDGFDGYADVSGEGLIHGLSFFNPPVTQDLPPTVLAIGSPAVISLLAKQVGATQAPERALVLVGVRDCTGAPGAGVALSAVGADPESVPFYAEAGLPSGSASQTDAGGYGGLLNVVPGSITFTATVAETDQRVGQVTLLTREGAITYGSIVPDGS